MTNPYGSGQQPPRFPYPPAGTPSQPPGFLQSPPGIGGDPGVKSGGSGPLWLSVAALVLLLVLVVSSVAQYLHLRATEAKYDELNCLSIVYDFEGKTEAEITDVDRQRAELHGCDLDKLLRDAPPPPPEEEEDTES